MIQKYNMHFLLLEPFPLEFSLTSKCSRIQGFLFKGFLFLFLTSLLEYNCFTMVGQFLLCNKVNQLQIYIYPHIPSLVRLPPTLPILPLQVVTKHRADLPVLCDCFPLAIYFTFGSVYLSLYTLPLSHFVPAYYPYINCLYLSNSLRI